MWTPESCADLPTLNDRWTDVVDQRARYISELDESRLMAELSFKLLSGDPSSMRLVDQMQHVANHATLHRGQVVGMIRQFGIDPPSTDLLFYLRSDISPKCHLSVISERCRAANKTINPLMVDRFRVAESFRQLVRDAEWRDWQHVASDRPAASNWDHR